MRVFERAVEARFTGPHTLTLDGGGELHAERFVLCAGGHARRMEFPGSEHALTHSDVWAMEALPSSFVVVGAAATGCQLAAVFAAFGSRVRLLDVAPHVLGGEEDVSRGVADAFGRRGIEILTGIGGIERKKTPDGRPRNAPRNGPVTVAG